jgi:signal transduction histidine kinase/HAMP domain-containing protein
MVLLRILILVLVGMVPTISIQTYNEFILRRARQLEVGNQAVNSAKRAAAELQQVVQGIRQVLMALSELPAIKENKSEVCNESLAGMKSQFPAFLTFLVVDVNGQKFCDSNDPKAVNVAVRSYFTTALNVRAFSVGEFSIGLSIHRRVIQFALPYYGEDGHVAGVIIAPLGLDWLAKHIARMDIPEGGALVLTDRNGTCLAGYPDNDDCVGNKPFPMNQDPEFIESAAAADIVGVDGIERIAGSSTLGPDSGGLRVTFGLAKGRAVAEIHRRTERDVLFIILSASTLLLLTLLGARQFIHRPLGQLVEAANQWRLGNYRRRVDLQDKSEINKVADAFNNMVDTLEHREQELSNAKETAKHAVARIKMIFESTTDNVILVDRDWRVSFLNQRACAQISEGRRKLIGITLREAVPDTDDTEIIGHLTESMSRQRPISFEAFCPRRNLWYAINAFPSCEGLAIFFRDITEHKYAVEQRRLIEEQLHQSQKMESVGQLTGGIAHDFNNLLAIVSGNLELIERTACNGNIREFAKVARRATDKGARLSAQLLGFSRKQRLNPKLINANELIVGFQVLIRHAVGVACEVELRTDAQLWPCHVDPSQLESALLNLAINGRDAMPNGGILVIETENVLIEQEVTGCPAGAYVRLSVADTGQGMPPEVCDRVFEPFFTTKEVGKGTGLGLSMVYGFVRQSGGHVTIESAVSKGTTVALYLPRASHGCASPVAG